MLREFRPADAPQLLPLLLRHFPEEAKLLGYRPSEFDAIVARLYRWHLRLILWIARVVQRPIFRFFVLEADGHIAATTLLTFSEKSGYVSMVQVDEPYRGRGYAKQLMREAEEASRKARRPYLVLDVLTDNAAARHLYERLGFQSLRSQAYYSVALAPAQGPEAPPVPTGIRLFQKSDEPALVTLAQGQLPAPVAEVLPVGRNLFHLPAAVYGALGSNSAAWVIDRGRGPEGFVRATISPAMDAGNVTAPILGPDVGLPEAQALLETAGHWLASQGAPRSVAELPRYNARGLVALQQVGYTEAFGVETLYKPTRAG